MYKVGHDILKLLMLLMVFIHVWWPNTIYNDRWDLVGHHGSCGVKFGRVVQSHCIIKWYRIPRGICPHTRKVQTLRTITTGASRMRTVQFSRNCQCIVLYLSIINQQCFRSWLSDNYHSCISTFWDELKQFHCVLLCKYYGTAITCSILCQRVYI